MEGNKTSLYVSQGEEFWHYEVDVDKATLARRKCVLLPAKVQYVWPHPSRRYLYVTSSDRVRGELGTLHHLTTFSVGADGSLEQVGNPLVLPFRPIHMTVDGAGAHIAVAYNFSGSKTGPGTVILYRIRDGGAVVEPPARDDVIDAGMYPHQARFTRDGATLLVCARGNDPSGARAEDPGALKQFRVTGTGLELSAEFGYESGLGPRHLDLHPTKPWIYVSMERGNKLCVHELAADGKVVPKILFTRSTLKDDANDRFKRQLASTIHVHPSGKFVYVGNRADSVVRHGDVDVLEGGENTLAVFRIDGTTGEPTLVEHVDTHGIHPRTFSLDRTGRLLIVGNLMTRNVREGESVKAVPIALSLFRVQVDGWLEFARKYELDCGGKSPFWTGII